MITYLGHRASIRTSVVLPRNSLSTYIYVSKIVEAHVSDSVLTKVLFSTPKGLLESPVIVIAGAAVPRTVEDAYHRILLVIFTMRNSSQRGKTALRLDEPFGADAHLLFYQQPQRHSSETPSTMN